MEEAERLRLEHERKQLERKQQQEMALYQLQMRAKRRSRLYYFGRFFSTVRSLVVDSRRKWRLAVQFHRDSLCHRVVTCWSRFASDRKQEREEERHLAVLRRQREMEAHADRHYSSRVLETAFSRWWGRTQQKGEGP